MIKSLNTFLRTEDGASTVDATMLMAALVSLALAVSATVSSGVEGLSGDVSTTLTDQDVGPAF